MEWKLVTHPHKQTTFNITQNVHTLNMLLHSKASAVERICLSNSALGTTAQEKLSKVDRVLLPKNIPIRPVHKGKNRQVK